ncbi:hypothetical protein P261_00350 [Lachnospiraceae bacterium TWA4]|nr:hypothetical protein P261_00350 [Lachnospiraceae bacterium TWA4]
MILSKQDSIYEDYIKFDNKVKDTIYGCSQLYFVDDSEYNQLEIEDVLAKDCDLRVAIGSSEKIMKQVFSELRGE